MIRITQNQLLNYTLNKNWLGQTQANSMAELLRQGLALPASTPLSRGLSAQVRLKRGNLGDSLQAEVQEHSLIRGVFMRGEASLISPAQFATYCRATARQIRRSFNVAWITWQIDQPQIDALGDAILRLLRQLPQREADLREALADQIQPLQHTTRGGHLKESDTLSLALRWLVATNRALISYPEMPASSLAPATHYAASEYWYPALPAAPDPPEAEAQTALVRDFLAAYGPVTEADIDFWTGLGKGERARAMGQLFREVTQVMVAGIPGAMLLLKPEAEALAATPDEMPSGCYFLPQDDPFIKAYKASRNRFLANPKHNLRVFRNTGETAPVIFAEGKIIGTWAWSEENAHAEKLSWQFFDVPSADLRQSVAQRGHALSQLLQKQ